MENHRVASIHPIHAWQKEKKRRERNKGARLEKAWLHRSETDTLYVGKKKTLVWGGSTPPRLKIPVNNRSRDALRRLRSAQTHAFRYSHQKGEEEKKKDKIIFLRRRKEKKNA